MEKIEEILGENDVKTQKLLVLKQRVGTLAGSMGAGAYVFAGMQNLSDFISDMVTLIPNLIPLVIVGVIIYVVGRFGKHIGNIIKL